MEMERDCHIGTTPIPTTFGLSVNLKEFKGKQYNILGWNREQNGMTSSKQTEFLNKGERECVDIYLEDGRKITCTPEHKMLTSNNEWIKANELKIGESRLKCSVKYPTISINDEIKDCNNWSLKVSDNLTLKTNTEDEYFKSMAFVRILGYLLTDGYISNKGISATIFIGHKIDLERLVEDIKLFAPITQTNFKANTRNIYIVKVPHSLVDSILDLDGIMTGAKVSQASTLPTFILDANCPLPLVREFLGGLFGGDGHTCNISKNTFSYISFSKSKVIGHIDSLKQMMENIKKLLQRFDIKGVTIQNSKINSASKKRLEDNEKNYEIVLHLDMHELIPFYEKIGFRYCCHKNQRMEAAVAYARLRCGVISQKKWIINKVDELTDYKQIKQSNSNKTISTVWAIKEAVEELKAIEPLLHNFAIPNASDIKEYLINGRGGGKIPSSKFPTSTEFLKNIDAYCWFKTNANESCYGVCRDSEVLPTMNLKVLDIRPGGIHPVYDIQVDKEESFLANGVVAHNCLIAHGAMGFLKERMMDVSDKFTVYICKECGLFSIVNPNGEDGERKCGGCENYSEFMELRIPYACKLLMQELEGMMITPRFNLPKPNI